MGKWGGYGHIPCKPDERDFKFVHAGRAELDLPQSIDLYADGSFPPSYDQGRLGSCGPNAYAAYVQHLLVRSKYPYLMVPSRLFSYYTTREIMGTVDEDSGVDNRSLFKAANTYGICPEQELDGTKPDWIWPYSDDGTTFKQKPSEACYKDAVLHKALKYESISVDRSSVLNALAAGNPVLFGFTVYQSFESEETAKTGVMQIPSHWPNLIDLVLGGHDVLAVGYELNKPMGSQDVKDWLIVRNSWGTSWGDNGRFYMPIDEVFVKYTSDAWVLTLIGV